MRLAVECFSDSEEIIWKSTIQVLNTNSKELKSTSFKLAKIYYFQANLNMLETTFICKRLSCTLNNLKLIQT